MSYFKFKKRPSKTTERQKLVRKLDDEFSNYIRLRDSDEHGIVTCITCEDKDHWTRVQCGHYMKRGNTSTRYNLQNSAGQCGLCNTGLDGMQEEHGKAIDLKYGEGTAEMLEKLSRQELHLAEHELKGMIDELRKEIRALKEEKGMI